MTERCVPEEGPEVLRGQVVWLRPLSRDDGPLIVRWRRQEEVARQLFGQPPTLLEHQRWFEAIQQGRGREEYVIVWNIGGRRPVGTIGLSGIDSRHRRAEFGILLGEREARGKGVALEASELIVRRAFADLRLERLYLHVFADNLPAIRLYQALGFAEEGRLRRHARRQDADESQDVLVMGLLTTEWRR